MRSGALISVSNISHIVGLLNFREKVRIFRITKIYRKNRLSVLTFFNHQWRPSGLPVMPISALFSLVSSVLPWISLVLFNIFTYLFLYLILHGQMHLISVTWEWPRFPLSSTCRSLSGASHVDPHLFAHVIETICIWPWSI